MTDAPHEPDHPSPAGRALAPVCILAGGLGTRLGSLVRDTPKPLLEVAGEPFLLHQLRLLASYGAHRVVLCVGYLGEQIEHAIGPARFGIEIAYSYDVGAEGTLGALRRAAPLAGERFLVLYGDTYLRIDYQAVDAQWSRSGMPGAMTVLHNAGKWQTSNAVYRAGRVEQYDKRHPNAQMEWIDYGLGGLTSQVLGDVDEAETDVAQLLHVLAERSLLFGYEAKNRFYEIGTPDALAETDTFLRTLARHER